VEAGIETARVSWILNPPAAGRQFEYWSIKVTVKKGGVIIRAGDGSTDTFLSGEKMSGPYFIGRLNDGRTLEADTLYQVELAGMVKLTQATGVWCSPTVINFRTSAAGTIAQTFLLTLESGVAGGKPGINFVAMPFAGPWYPYRSDGVTKIGFTYGGSTKYEIRNALDLVLAIDGAARGTGIPRNVVSTFGEWDKRSGEQKDAGVLIPANDPFHEPAYSELQSKILRQGEGYQVYLTEPAKLELVIKNTPTP
jgi:hypothetical protein